ncbi:uncharacterized protein LOC143222093 isoform X2 [Tachypleus tridentatus]|uniref:uncharacterized protein LOC143222093 isoform X2 n=1 Tax=Tachypleus tridentatus TaxID=6853 RepID=UPI003FD4CC99
MTPELFCEKRYQCEICLAYFTLQPALSRHRRFKHTNIPYFVCDICGKAFRRPDALKNHKKKRSSSV